MKRECSETVERMTREQINDKAELVSLQTAKTELERLLQAQKIRTQVERETREDLHSKTIKVHHLKFCETSLLFKARLILTNLAINID